MSLKDKYPNQTYVDVPVIITGSNHLHVFAVIADHGLIPTKVKFQKEWPNKVQVWAKIYVPVDANVRQNQGTWDNSWEHLTFLTPDVELISLATKKCSIVTNAAGISFITSNRDNKRPSYFHCE